MQCFVENLSARKTDLSFDLWAYVLVPEHVHLLLLPRKDDYSISRIPHALKRPVSYRARQLGVTFEKHFWQPGGGYDRNLLTPAAVHREVGYIHANPVRLGLVEQPEQWPFSSAGFWADQPDVPLEVDRTLPVRENHA